MSLREEQCKKVCRILDDVLANRPTERDSLIVAVRKAFAQPKRGEWLPDNNNYIYEQYVCSECKNSFKVDTCKGKPMWNFCPNCGAKMEETT